MPTNEFYEFATSSAAYVESLPDYLADVEQYEKDVLSKR